MVISNAIICDVNGEKKADIRIENNVIVEIGSNLTDSEMIDAKGSYFIPSLIDTNISLKDSNLNAKNIKTISDEALLGGVGHVVLNPNTTPAIDNEIVLEFAQNSIRDLNGVKIDLMLNSDKYVQLSRKLHKELKEKVEEISSVPRVLRRTYFTLKRLEAPISAGQVSQITHRKTSTERVYLNKLTKAGLVKKIMTKKDKIHYSIIKLK